MLKNLHALKAVFTKKLKKFERANIVLSEADANSMSNLKVDVKVLDKDGVPRVVPPNTNSGMNQSFWLN